MKNIWIKCMKYDNFNKYDFLINHINNIRRIDNNRKI